MMAVTVSRHAIADDCEHIIGLFKEQVKSGEKKNPPSVDDLKTYCLNGENSFNILIAEWNHKAPSKAVDRPSTGPLVGYMFYQYIFSTWEGMTIQITDLYVSPLPQYEFICKDLFHFLSKMSVDENCVQVQWRTNGNNDLKNLSKYFNAMNMTEMANCLAKKLEKHQLKEICSSC
ncbi:thialysine N-epsilon-acetyltransferase [Octopus bimaculoides]|uniref:thialysine N-epsilon-acetyltransferase n=1 Tax=Octopus bimaculoides TaxID=37653 RepID=UPI0022E8BCCA|nr:thialysine N-epsilon-acetyltransferase [Octopus bimaculoides]